jgi:serine/threonine-protein kinase RsbW
MKRILKIESDLSKVNLVEREIDQATREAGISEDNYGKILVSVMEAVNNAIIHGNKSNPEKTVLIEIEKNGNELKVIVSDEGEGFVPERIPDPTVYENIEEENGRGVFLMRKLADEIKFNRKGNSVTMKFKI